MDYLDRVQRRMIDSTLNIYGFKCNVIYRGGVFEGR